ncbi:MAG: DMT family transporter [Pseudomonadota bacterium]
MSLENARAIALMTLSMAGFAVGDAMVKTASDYMSIAQILIFMATPAAVLFAVMAHRSGQSVFSRSFLSGPVALRNSVEAVTAICMVSALAMAPLALVISITQAVPLFVTIGAAVVLRETVGPRRWAAVLIGLVGVLLMLRPSEGGLSLGAALALAAALGLALRDLVTRITPVSIGTLQMAAWGMFALIPAGIVMLPFTGPHENPSALGWLTVGVASIANAGAYYAITAAMRLGDVSAVTPFRYSRLLFALIIAIVFFAERPDILTLIGAAIVIGSGLFVMWRERKASVSDNN